eukprot:1160497-Pelagomonas_calceolata.AAC.1
MQCKFPSKAVKAAGPHGCIEEEGEGKEEGQRKGAAALRKSSVGPHSAPVLSMSSLPSDCVWVSSSSACGTKAAVLVLYFWVQPCCLNRVCHVSVDAHTGDTWGIQAQALPVTLPGPALVHKQKA